MKSITELTQSEFASAYKKYSTEKRLIKKLERERAAQNREKMR